ncbi:translation elongation factor Ts (EF-Ts) [Sulfurivirga caldicuralii]|uniref:Elongation factor Ts n=1 Tax=Sulfurivirga caldicuralii TaxID=364032 RepID=A0A1N6E063_9GAMM|nr:translation elongation factor Ts [Sulfurivirga caldicuralii]SIN76391.1 translation elongation factor Ts (EF-Ts) [Sulfurivirga caldicuralii]
MAAITASMVKELRERTGAGMMDCKKALAETNGDMDAAVDLLRKKGMASADKKADRVAAEGIIAVAVSEDGKKAAIVEVNCETDFVAKGDDFQNFANEVAKVVLETGIVDPEALASQKLPNGQTIDETRRELIAKIGENIQIRRAELLQTENGHIGVYRHGDRIGVVVMMEGGDDTLVRDVAMHIAATKPAAISAEDVPAEVIAHEREIFAAQARESGKPENIIEKMIEGRINKFLKEVTLLGQQFVKNPDVTVEQLLKDADAAVKQFARLEVGEGIEKKEENFAEEVAKQAAAAQGN